MATPPNDEHAEQPKKPEKSSLTREDKALLRQIGSNLRRIISGEDFIEVSPRIDDFGILANMVNRVGRELRESRQRDLAQRQELEQKLQELQATQTELQTTVDKLQEAKATEERLSYTVKELSTPILSLHPDILLLPIIGVMDDERAQLMLEDLLKRVAATSCKVLILDITGMPVVDTQVANIMLHSAQAVRLLGARTILCGMTPDVAQVIVSLGIQLESLYPSSDLQVALEQAFKLIGFKITRR